MSSLLALLSAVVFGLGDFMGGLSSRRMAVWGVLAWSQALGVPVLVLGLFFVEWTEVRGVDIGLGALAGLVGLVGLSILYAALASGVMSVVAPVAGAVSATVPVIADVGGGASLELLEWVGIVVAVVAVAIMGIDRAPTREHHRSLAMALAAGGAFGLFFVMLSATSEESGLWPLVAARSVTIPAALFMALALRVAGRPRGRTLGLVAGAGAFDVSANVALLVSLQRGPLAINAVLSSLFPAFTALSAVVLLRERPGASRAGGIALALVAAGLLAT